MSISLFRIESVNAKKERILGDVLLTRPLAFSVLTALFVFLAVLLLAFVVWGDYTRKSRVSGYLIPDKGLIKLYSPQTGLITKTFVSEGMEVNQGDTLFIISMERSSSNTLDARAAVMEKIQARSNSLSKALDQQSTIDQLTLTTLNNQRDGILTELELLESEIATQKRRVSNAERLLQRFEQLKQKRYTNELEVERNEEELLDRQLTLQALQRQYSNLQRQVDELDLKLTSEALRADNERAAIERNITLLAQQLQEYELQREVVVHAPTSGVVTAILSQPGQTASPDRPLLSILPEGTQLEAQLLVPSRSIGFIETQQSVSLRYHAFPFQRFGIYEGKVIAIAKTMLLPGEANLPIALDEPVYQVTVQLDSQTVTAYGRFMDLQPGMLLEADIKLDTRPLYQWILDPLYSISGKV